MTDARLHAQRTPKFIHCYYLPVFALRFTRKAILQANRKEKHIKALLPQKLALEPLPKEDRAIKMPESSKPDNMNHPRHYCKGGIECIDAIRAAVSDLQGVEAVYWQCYQVCVEV